MINKLDSCGLVVFEAAGAVGGLVRKHESVKAVAIDEIVSADMPASPLSWHLTAVETIERYGVDLDQVSRWFTTVNNHLKLSDVVFRLWAMDCAQWIDKSDWFLFVSDFFRGWEAAKMNC